MALKTKNLSSGPSQWGNPEPVWGPGGPPINVHGPEYDASGNLTPWYAQQFSYAPNTNPPGANSDPAWLNYLNSIGKSTTPKSPLSKTVASTPGTSSTPYYAPSNPLSPTVSQTSPTPAPLMPTVTGGPSAILNTIGSYSSAIPGTGANPITTGTGTAGATDYPVNPLPQGTSYSSTFGGVPGSISVPNPFQDLSGVYPNLSGTNAAASQALLSELTGQVSPETQALLQDESAALGVSQGMPGSQFSKFGNLRNLGLTSEQLMGQGLGQYAGLLGAVSGTQTVNPNLQAEIAARNAQMLAAPIPSAAASYAQQLFNDYLNRLRGPGGGTGSAGSPAAGTGASGLGFGFGTLGPFGQPTAGNPNAVATTSSTDTNNPNFDPSNPNLTDQQLMDYLTGTQLPTGGQDQSGVDLSQLYPSPFDEGGGF